MQSYHIPFEDPAAKTDNLSWDTNRILTILFGKIYYLPLAKFKAKIRSRLLSLREKRAVTHSV